MIPTKRLDQVASIIMGQAPAGESYNTTGEGRPLIAGAGDFKDGKLAPVKHTTQAAKLSGAWRYHTQRVIQGTGTLCEVYPVRRYGTIKMARSRKD